MPRKYYIEKTRKDRKSIQCGTIEELTNYYSYTLECGNSWNNKINRNPKTIASLVNNLNRSVDEIQGGCYNRDYYRISTKEEYDVTLSKI